MAAVQSVSPDQFGLPDAGREVEKAIGSQEIYSQDGYKPKRISTGGLHASQDYINPDQVHHYIQHGSSQANRGGRDAPHVVQLNGKRVVWNGHHRIAAALMNGQKQVSVRFTDLDKR